MVPVILWRGHTNSGLPLTLGLHLNRFRLETEDAFYSDDAQYRPIKVLFQKMGADALGLKHVLVLGAGIGSAILILKRIGLEPKVTLVDIEPQILHLAKAVCRLRAPNIPVEFIHADAQAFVSGERSEMFELLIVDLFVGRSVPAFVHELFFIQQCRRIVSPGGTVAFNFMVHSGNDWDRFLGCVRQIFAHVNVHKMGINRLVMATA